MQLIDGRPVYSATDLVGYLACEHLTNLERAAVAGLVARPNRVDPELDRIQKRGFQHEQRFLADLQADGLTIVEIAEDEAIADRGARLRDRAARTRQAMVDGADVVYQATFFDGTWLGYADFLRKVATPSVFGPWSYEAWDTKLARHVKGSAILQLCLYTDFLGQVQGRDPERLHVALGGSARAVEHLRYADFAAYYRLVKADFLAFAAAGEPAFPPPTRPDPVEHCDVCRWSLDCARARRAADDLSLVAGITGRQRRALRERDIGTRTALGNVGLPLEPPLDGTSRESLSRVREQARIQVAGDAVAPTVLHELLDPARTRDGGLEPNRGLLGLPPPSPGDLFFDIEGDPFALEDGVDYLFGVIEPGRPDPDDPDRPAFHAIWSIDADRQVTLDAERRAFEQLIDLFIDRLERDPNLHIYHYAAYEPTAVGRLMGRYGTREREVDRLLRGDVFVDLYRAARQGIRASVESYSIKRLEPLYGFAREIDLRDAGSSIVAFETWLELGGEVEDDPHILERIEAYNRDDCVSNLLLRDWLEAERPALAERLGIAAADLPRPELKDGLPSEQLNAQLAHVEEIAGRLTAGVSDDAAERTPDEQARWLLAQLLSWHRREAKSSWWRYFHLIEDLTDEERIEEPEPIGGLEYVGIVGETARSYVHRYRFPPQEHDISAGRQVVDPATKRQRSAVDLPKIPGPGTVEAVDEAAGTIDLKRSKTSDAPHPTSLVPDLVVPTEAQEASLIRIGEWVAANGVDGDGRFLAARDLLRRRPPRVGRLPGLELRDPGEGATDAARRLVRALDASCLAIQGPPGSGKTTIGAEMIVDLVKGGRQVGVTSNSHKVIGNLLRKVGEAASRRGVAVRIGQKPADGSPCTYADARPLGSNADARRALTDRELDVVGGTAWLWSREELAGAVDVLFVDEAGQVSLANVVAVSPAGASLVLLGDPQQLDQPVQGSHPPGADRSALAHLLGERATMPGELGLFLDGTWRLHPDICTYTSEVFYEGRLEPYPGRDLQAVVGSAPLEGVGLRFLPVIHAGNSNDSGEEAAQIARLIGALIESGATWVDDAGRERALRLDDVLVITPYNAQVRTIGRALPDAHVGTVDKFQGQEAPISIYSMATSTPEDAPRGMEFLYSLHRLNVATSRARCVTAVVASPELVRVRCRTPRQMQLANAFARLVELAAVSQTAPGSLRTDGAGSGDRPGA